MIPLSPLLTLVVAAGLAGPEVSAPRDVAAPSAGAQLSRTGVASKRLHAGKAGPPPADNDIVTLSYTTWRRDGRVTSSPDGQPRSVTEPVRTLMPGLVEVLKAMSVGEQRRVWVPAPLTYRRDDDDAAPNVDLTIDVELVAVMRAPAPPRPLGPAPRSARRMPSGLAYRLVHAGRGERHPGVMDRVTVSHSVWAEDGQLFESSVMAQHPTSLRLLELAPGLREALQTMRVGDRTQFWIPAHLAFGERARRGVPSGPLTCDIELLSID